MFEIKEFDETNCY